MPSFIHSLNPLPRTAFLFPTLTIHHHPRAVHRPAPRPLALPPQPQGCTSPAPCPCPATTTPGLYIAPHPCPLPCPLPRAAVPRACPLHVPTSQRQLRQPTAKNPDPGSRVQVPVSATSNQLSTAPGFFSPSCAPNTPRAWHLRKTQSHETALRRTQGRSLKPDYRTPLMPDVLVDKP